MGQGRAECESGARASLSLSISRSLKKKRNVRAAYSWVSALDRLFISPLVMVQALEKELEESGAQWSVAV